MKDKRLLPEQMKKYLLYGGIKKEDYDQVQRRCSEFSVKERSAICKRFPEPEVTAYGSAQTQPPLQRLPWQVAGEMLKWKADGQLRESLISADARIVKPMTMNIDLENVPDGEYPAAFDLDDLKDDKLTLTLFTVDSYDNVDISTLAVGDYIFIDGEILEVESLDEDEYGDLQINGGLEGDGYDLRAYDEDNCWRVAELDDYPTWTEQGEVTLSLAKGVKYADSSDIDGDMVTAVGVAEMIQVIEETGEDSFDEYDTTVRIEAGNIVEIVRVYAP